MKDNYRIVNIFPTGIYFEEIKNFTEKNVLKHSENYFKNVLKSHSVIKPTLIGYKKIQTKNKREFFKDYNCYLSGIIFEDVDETDKINFFRQKYQHIKPHVSEYNLYNSESWWFKVKKNQIVIFPSYLNYNFENTTKRLKKINIFQIMFKGIGTSLVMDTIDKGEGVMI
jgi:hypothetical protein